MHETSPDSPEAKSRAMEEGRAILKKRSALERYRESTDAAAEEFKIKSLKEKNPSDIMDTQLREAPLPEPEQDQEETNSEDVRETIKRLDGLGRRLAAIKTTLEKKGIKDIDVSSLEVRYENIQAVLQNIDVMSPQERREYLSVPHNKTAMKDGISYLESNISNYENFIKNHQ